MFPQRLAPPFFFFFFLRGFKAWKEARRGLEKGAVSPRLTVKKKTTTSESKGFDGEEPPLWLCRRPSEVISRRRLLFLRPEIGFSRVNLACNKTLF